MGIQDLFKTVINDYKDTANKAVNVYETGSQNYRNEYLRRYQPPYKCNKCGKVFPEATPDMHIDHIIPKAYGGTSAMTNLQVLCVHCNTSKNAEIDLLAIKYSGEALIREIKRRFGK